ncbi:MAG TPA: beta-ketoacyl synthase N-terminal-like domain-containing protein [Solirubrobacteraceae bacterium]|jgi:3-oxoacyl-(acyl-carrier-protein) synthase
MTTETDIVITGLGIVSPYGIGAAPLARAVMSDQLAQRLCTTSGWPHAAARTLPCARVAESDVAAVLDGEPRGFLNAESRLLLAAARLALADARRSDDGMQNTGIAVSTRHAGLQDYADLFWTGLAAAEEPTASHVGRTRISPAQGPQSGLNAPAAHLSIRLGAKGPNITFTNGAVGGIDALAYAVGALRSGRATTMLVGGVDVIPQVTHGLPMEDSGPDVPLAPRPFDRDRSGPLLSEAGVIAVLEQAQQAEIRGVPIQASVRAVSATFAPNRDLKRASVRSLISALSACSLAPHEVRAVFAGANGSIAGDAAESHALHAVFGDSTAVCAVKGATADSLGAAALVQLAAAVSSLRRRWIPPTAGFQSPGQDIAAIRILTAPEPLLPGPVVVHAWDMLRCSATAVLERSSTSCGDQSGR